MQIERYQIVRSKSSGKVAPECTPDDLLPTDVFRSGMIGRRTEQTPTDQPPTWCSSTGLAPQARAWGWANEFWRWALALRVNQGTTAIFGLSSPIWHPLQHPGDPEGSAVRRAFR